MSHRLRLTAEKIAQRLGLLAKAIARQRQSIEPFRLDVLADATQAADPSIAYADAPGETLAWNAHWGGQNLHFAMRSRFTVPKSWSEPALNLPLGVAGDIFTHPEALLSIDGTPIASADRYHHTIEVPLSYADGQPHELLLEGWTGLTGWPPDPANRTQLFMRECAVIDVDRRLESFLILAECAFECAEALTDDRPEKHDILSALDAAFLILDTRDPLGDVFRASVAPAHQGLSDALAAIGGPMDVRLHAIGHAHMDIAYLWPIAQIRRKNARTTANVLRLMDRHPDFTFTHSQPQLYAWLEQDYPALFERVRAQVAEGRWEVLGGMWIEPDTNMPGGEALVRQILLARTWCADRFGAAADTQVLWLPDTFGFTGALPQLMQQAGLTGFVTNKVTWNQYNRMPASTTWWEGIDGSRVLAHFLTTPREVQHLPFPSTYKSTLSAGEVLGTWHNNTVKDRVRDLPIAFGYGDGGGGPTEGLVQRVGVFGRIPGTPQMQHSTAARVFAAIADHANPLPVWQGELYMEGHRGVLTSQGWIKRANRKAEVLLHDVELAQSLALAGGHGPHDLTGAWERLCVNQFHDILTGTSITEVFEEARLDYDRIATDGTAALTAALSALTPPGAAGIVLDGAPLGLPRTILLPLDSPPVAEDRPLAAQLVADGVLVEVPSGTPLSVRTLHPAAAWGRPDGDVEARADAQPDGGIVMENPQIRLTLGPDGALVSIFDKAAAREVLKPGEVGNRLELFEDRPISWDAWDIDIFFEDRREVIGGLTRLEILESGPLRAVVRVCRQFRASALEQRIVLHRRSRRIDFETVVDWHETHLLLKTAFPVAVRASRATYEIQWGQIDRTTHSNTSWDAAQFEVPAQKWADISEGDYGVALLNDCKYGYDVHGDVLRLSLIKAATMPDPKADQGQHVFTYSLLPHQGADLSLVRAEAYALNHPPHWHPSDARSALATAATPSWLIRCDSPRVVIETVKPALDGTSVIVRLYEAMNTRGPVRLALTPWVTRASRTTLMEDGGEPLPIDGGVVELTVQPFEIVTLRLEGPIPPRTP